MSEELKECPFCGGTETGIGRFESRRWVVQCYSTDCICEGPHRATKREAIAAWNTRTPPKPTSPASSTHVWRDTMTDQLPERIWAEVIDSSGCWHFGPTKMAESETLFIRADTAVTKAEADAMVGHIESTVGHWLSAVLEDPNVCAEMKADIGKFFTATEDARAAFELALGAAAMDAADRTEKAMAPEIERRVRVAVEAAKREWALQYLSDESQQLEAIDAAVEAERERCAQISENVHEYQERSPYAWPTAIAAAIRKDPSE